MKVEEITKDSLRRAAKKVFGKSALEKKLFGTSVHQGRANALMSRCAEEGIDISHWTGLHIKKPKLSAPRKKYEDLTWTAVKCRFRKEFVEICAECGLQEEWNDKKIVLNVDHINGNNKDHRVPNLRFLCPNCHSQTPTFGGRRNRKLPPDEEVIELSKTHSYTEIAKMLKVDLSTVSNTLRKYRE